MRDILRCPCCGRSPPPQTAPIERAHIGGKAPSLYTYFSQTQRLLRRVEHVAARYGHLINKWTVAAVAGLALMVALLAIALPAWAQSNGSPPQLTVVPPNSVEHNENDDGPVYTFRAIDPDGDSIFWSVSGTDADDFTIENGVLKFKSPPDFEIQLDATTAAEPNTPTTGSDGTYEVRLRFSDGGNAATHLLRVEVQDVEEPGMVMLSPLQPQVGTPLQAVIMDLDGLTTDTSGNPSATYRWAKSDSMGGMPTDIAGATGRTYTPVEVDEGSYLQVTVVYLEHASTRPAKTEVGKATLPVRPDTHMNEAPVVPLTGQGHSGTGLEENPITRYVSENMPAGTKVGPRVTGVDDNLDVLTYAFGGTPAQMTAAEPFDIDPATGQITTNRVLDFAEDTEADANDTREVVVTATDPDGDVLNIRVDIRVTDVNEPGVFPLITDPDRSTTAANRERSIVEGTPDVPLTGNALIIGTYTAPDQDDSNATITWTTGGIDGDSGFVHVRRLLSP